jgi:hypothetical protein
MTQKGFDNVYMLSGGMCDRKHLNWCRTSRNV